jgi:uncharacterized protein YbaA (DUF1428 family)
MTYITSFATPVPIANKQAFVDFVRADWEMFKGYGALSITETWGEDVPDGKVTSFPLAVQKKDDEVVALSWIVWPDRETANAAWAKMMNDPAMKGKVMPFDGQRMIWGGFAPIFES